jgi:hypothetical protein
MSAQLLNPSACREDALNALIEIRACRDELQTFLEAAFDRLDHLVDGLRSERSGQGEVKHPTDGGTLQNQIDLLARMAAELAQSVAKRGPRTAGQSRTRSQEAET